MYNGYLINRKDKDPEYPEGLILVDHYSFDEFKHSRFITAIIESISNEFSFHRDCRVGFKDCKKIVSVLEKEAVGEMKLNPAIHKWINTFRSAVEKEKDLFFFCD